MKKYIFAFLMICLGASHIQAQLLYKISGNGLQKPSYIIGTNHFADVHFVNQIKGVNDALTATEQVYGELDMTDVMSTENTTKMQTAMMLPKDKTLTDLLTLDQQQRLNDCLKELMGADMRNGQVAAVINRMTPSALSTQLTLSMYLKNHQGEFDPMASFDQYFQTQAKANHKPVGGLETLDFQIKTLFQGQSLERQVQLLMCLVDHRSMMQQTQEDLSKAYYKQDLDGIKAAMDEKLNNSCDDTPEEAAVLIDNRNTDWIKKMQAIMAAHPTFFAVGAAHLPGDHGVLTLLKQVGYTVEGVK